MTRPHGTLVGQLETKGSNIKSNAEDTEDAYV